jgi:hypothetical protein
MSIERVLVIVLLVVLVLFAIWFLLKVTNLA